MTDKYGMSSHKLPWHHEKLAEWQQGKRFVPIHIQIGITTGCNIACLGCYGQEIGQTDLKNKYDMPRETVRRLFKDSKDLGIKSITLIGEGENTIHPNFYDIIGYAREINLDLGIATNAVVMRKDKMEDILRSFVWIRNSLWAATREKYEEVQGKDRFNQVVSNVAYQVDVKRRKNLETTIGLQMVVRGENIDHIVPLAKLGRELGVDYFVVKPCADTPGRKFGIPFEELKNIEEKLARAEEYSVDGYSVIIKRDKFQSGDVHPFKTCYGTEFAIAIDARGNVAPCGHLLGYRKEEFNIGNINNTPFAEILSSDRYKEVQAKVKSLDVDKECETNCMHYHMNQFLEPLKQGRIKLEKPTGKPPPHINFP